MFTHGPMRLGGDGGTAGEVRGGAGEVRGYPVLHRDKCPRTDQMMAGFLLAGN